MDIGILKKIFSSLTDNLIMTLVIIVLHLLYIYHMSGFDFFKRKGIPFLKPVMGNLGHLGPRINTIKSFHKLQLDIYEHFKGNPLGGAFDGRQPVLYIMDPDIIKAITIRDFDYFTDRNLLSVNRPRYLRQSLLNLKGVEWKSVRRALTPTFSSGRLKNMLPLIEQCTHQMVEYLKKYVNKETEMKEAMGHFTLEVIGACAFGIKCDALSSETAHFYKVAAKFGYMSKFKRMLILTCMVLMPKLITYFNISLLNLNSADELVKMLQAAKAERKRSNSRENDFLQILIDFANKEKKELGKGNAVQYLDDDTIDAQCLLFLIAGYETSSTLLSFAIHELAVNPHIQDRLRAHIKELTDGKEMSYELLSELDYLDGFLLEILRLYPPIVRIDRLCTKPYTIPNTSVRLNVGDAVALPVHGIHMDPKYYPEPHVCRPERFMGDEKNQRPSHLFLAFGSGPRNCIGSRFAMISAKTAMVSLMKNYKFSACSKTVYPNEFDKKPILLKSVNGLWVRVESS